MNTVAAGKTINTGKPIHSEAVLQEACRLAYVRGAKFFAADWTPADQLTAEQQARLRYPITTVRERVIQLCPDLWVTTRSDGSLRFTNHLGQTAAIGSADFNPEQTRQIVDLLENPYEEIEE